MAARPLQNVRILDFTQSIAGPVCTTLLADFGADVVTIEPPSGSSHRHFVDGSIFPNFGRNKKSVVIDLQKDGSEDVIAELTATADVVVHNFKPGTMEQLGCDYETLREYNEDIVYCSITGYGESGPYRDRPAYDPIAQAMSGMMHMTGEQDRKPSRAGGSVIDVGTGIYGAFAVMLALWRRDCSGEGNKIEVSLLETAATIMGYYYTYAETFGDTPPRNGSHYPPYAPYGLFETGDGYVYVAAPLPKQWTQLCRALDRDDLVDDPRFATNDDRVANRDEMVDILESEFESYSTNGLVETLLQENVAVGELQTPADAVTDEHLHQRNSLTGITTQDGETVTAIGRTIHFADEEAAPEFDRLPELGQDTVEELREAGFDDDAITEFQRNGIINQSSRTDS